jgi:death-on-curing protein
VSDFLTTAEVLTIHEVMIDRFGGAQGIRDRGALESALFRPQTGYYDDVIDEAAALMESLLQNHPFVDGNKRVAVAATDVFLRLNGVRLDINDDEAYRFLVGLIEDHDVTRQHLVTWLREHTTRS